MVNRNFGYFSSLTNQIKVFFLDHLDAGDNARETFAEVGEDVLSSSFLWNDEEVRAVRERDLESAAVVLDEIIVDCTDEPFVFVQNFDLQKGMA